MKILSKLILSCAFAFTISSCTKTPVADFITNKTVYTAGETVYTTNRSEDAVSYLWEFEGNQSTSSSPSFVIPANHTDGNFTIYLKAYSKKNKKSDQASASITIEKSSGSVVFWAQTALSSIEVVLGGFSRYITYVYSSAPDCGTNGVATFADLSPGTYPYTASDGINFWSDNITITAGSCTAQKLVANNGNVVFWQQVGSGHGNTTVTISTTNQYITNDYSSTPDCGSSGCATFNALSTGAHSYYATDGVTSWSGTVNISAGQCSSILLL